MRRLRRPSVLRDSVRVALSVATLATVLTAATFATTGCSGPQSTIEEPAVESAPEAPRPPYTIYRDEMDRTLQRGLQPLIAEVSLRPVHDGARFLGWRLQFLKPGQSPYRESAVRPGDVLLRVNGSPIERPDQMMKTWKALEGADRLTFSVLRGGKPIDVTYSIVDRLR